MGLAENLASDRCVNGSARTPRPGFCAGNRVWHPGKHFAGNGFGSDGNRPGRDFPQNGIAIASLTKRQAI